MMIGQCYVESDKDLVVEIYNSLKYNKAANHT